MELLFFDGGCLWQAAGSVIEVIVFSNRGDGCVWGFSNLVVLLEVSILV